MALVSTIEPSTKSRTTVHKPTRCLYAIVDGGTGERYVQLDTLGSDDRLIADKVSQSIQFNKESAEQMIKLFKEAFPDLI